MKYVMLFALAAAVLGVPATPASAQLPDLPISVELGAGLLSPLGEWDVEDRNTALRAASGPTFSGAVRVHLPEGLSTYGSYHHGFPGCEDCDLFGLDDRLVDAGFGLGIGYALPDIPPVALRLDLGAIAHRLTFRDGGESRSSNHGVGIQAAVAGSYEIRPSLFIEPSLEWRGYTARFEFEEGGDRDVKVRSLAPQVGLRYRIR